MQQTHNCTPKIVDARGMACPMPLLKAKQALSKIKEGEQLRLLATDPGSVKDIRRFVELSVHALVEYRHADDHHVFILQRGAA